MQKTSAKLFIFIGDKNKKPKTNNDTVTVITVINVISPDRLIPINASEIKKLKLDNIVNYTALNAHL